MIYVMLSVVLVALLALSGLVAWGLFVALPDANRASDAPDMPSIHAELVERIQTLEQESQLVRQAVATGIENVERVERRIRGTVRRAKKELDSLGIEHAGLDAEASELSQLDALGGGEEGLSPVRQSVEDAISSIPGVSQKQLWAIRGG
jgi:hypothetical protein